MGLKNQDSICTAHVRTLLAQPNIWINGIFWLPLIPVRCTRVQSSDDILYPTRNFATRQNIFLPLRTCEKKSTRENTLGQLLSRGMGGGEET